MNRSLWIMLALAVASGGAAAEWTSLGDQGPAVVYVDKASVTRAGGTAKMWSLQELKAPATAGGAAYVSLKRQDEFDCKQPRSRGVQISAYPQAMGEGKAVASEKGSGKWTEVVAGSTTEVLWKIACGKE